MRALIGFMYLRGLYGLNHHKIDIPFSDKTGPPIFGAIFSENRVKFLLASISFISKDECIKIIPKDRFVSCCPMFELFNANCSKYLVPTLYMTKRCIRCIIRLLLGNMMLISRINVGFYANPKWYKFFVHI